MQRYYIFFNWQNVFLSFSLFFDNILLRIVIFFFDRYILRIILFWLNPDFFSILEYEYNIINALAGVRPHMQAGVCMYKIKCSGKKNSRKSL